MLTSLATLPPRSKPGTTNGVLARCCWLTAAAGVTAVWIGVAWFQQEHAATEDRLRAQSLLNTSGAAIATDMDQALATGSVDG